MQQSACIQRTQNWNFWVETTHLLYTALEEATIVPAHVKQETTKNCVNLCFKDICPHDVVANDGFANILQHVIIPVKHGQFDVKDILPHSTTVSRHVEKKTKAQEVQV